MSYNNDKILEKYFFAAKDEKSIFKAKEMRTLIEKSTSPSAKSNYLKKNGGRIIIISLIIGLITIVSLQLTNDIHTQEETTQLTITNKQINESDNFEPKAVGTNLVTLRDTHIISNSNEDKKNKSNATEKQPQEPKETEPQISLSNDIIEKTDLPEDPPILIINDDINEPEIEITNENTSPTVANTEKASIAEKYLQELPSISSEKQKTINTPYYIVLPPKVLEKLGVYVIDNKGISIYDGKFGKGYTFYSDGKFGHSRYINHCPHTPYPYIISTSDGIKRLEQHVTIEKKWNQSIMKSKSLFWRVKGYKSKPLLRKTIDIDTIGIDRQEMNALLKSYAFSRMQTTYQYNKEIDSINLICDSIGDAIKRVNNNTKDSLNKEHDKNLKSIEKIRERQLDSLKKIKNTFDDVRDYNDAQKVIRDRYLDNWHGMRDEYLDKLHDVMDVMDYTKNKSYKKEEKKIKKIISKIHDVNYLLPIAIPLECEDDPNFYFLAWYQISPEFIDVLPDNIKYQLLIELNLAQNGEYCRKPNEEEALLGVWQTCNGILEGMQVYPNPADDEVNVSFILKEKCKVAIKVYDLSANLIEILRKPKRLKPDGYTFKYDLSSYQPGMYLIVVETNYGDKTVQRVLRN